RTAALGVATYRADTCRLTFGDTPDVEIHHDPERRAS
ncbi:GntR family transcriptional regulator, partial [Streptomyces sp. SID4982]|nr:GntR family transcriptional regulator [Streptomyces sp. SID4982]